MKNFLILFLGLGIGAGGFWFFARHAQSEAKEEDAKHAEHAESLREGEFKVTKEQQAAAGLKTTAPEAARLPATMRGYGRVLDPTTIVPLQLDLQTARAALDASSKEYDRVKALYGQNQNASARAFEAAEAQVKRDRAQVALAQAKLQTGLGPAIALSEKLPEIIDALVQMKWSLVRVDLVGNAPDKLPDKFRVGSLANEKALYDAELLGPAPVAEASLQGQGMIGLVRTNVLVPNIAIFGLFDDPSEMKEGFWIPGGAALQDGADIFAIVQSGDETFKKQEIELDRMTGGRAFITEGLSATNRVVVEGAHQLLSISKAGAAD